MNFLLPYKMMTSENEFEVKTSLLQIDSETDETFTMTRILPPGCWSANVITIQKSYCSQIEQDGETFWTVNIDDISVAVLSWE